MSERDEHLADDELAQVRQLLIDTEDVRWEPPPAGVWERIEAEIRAGEDDAELRTVAEIASSGAPTEAGSPHPVDLAARRGARERSRLLAIAAAAVLVVAGAAVVLTRGNDGGDVIAAGELAPLGPVGSGSAEVVERDGTRRLRIETDGIAADDGYLEVWLLDEGVTRFVSLGPLRPDGEYDLPVDVDLAEFPVVDISAEPLDGDPAHSGASLLRGQLT